MMKTNTKKAKYDDDELFEKVLVGMSWLESHLREIIQTMVKDADISFEQFLILYYLDHSTDHRITVKELAADRHVSSSAISRKLTYLINNDLIVLNIDPYDRRYRYLTLTEKGEKMARTIEKVNEERLGNFLDEFGRIRTSELTDELRMVSKVLVDTKEIKG
ncbi:MarR family transcriptional regulator [Lactiplantibacillus pentosus]|uniref:Putative transcription regulator n=1 Tax=Lactiplantibacillus pentosus IG1 TaxID=1042160 RepID=G0M1W6_LACPE|nr:MarR family winged helix-turn-helix transcriptional regulator [Lactiplantibacillus pentosus]CCC18586.1 putative transcription regulator [Lactiplantibacillus pentosus IG1]MCT3284658.1 MarR family transcriptional regulator [Lactiplantibacillus pentosus]MCT3304415.1 MarR family transcriptional regulator [Lactiplantibacillus pentosus]PRO81059.1 MarR family transcriptional regulator [Lactiplantibacillus pentosus]PRO81289.1 MarR family transcriptional regulator [Lactiplantibacillus pentosus]